MDVPPGSGRGAIEGSEILGSVLAEVDLVVRVEVASVTLPAGELGGVRPGDVVETSVPLGAPAVLRVAGREVARGELVSVDGKIGVRVTELLGSE